jgi:outer membrane protein assembly factor BamB
VTRPSLVAGALLAGVLATTTVAAPLSPRLVWRLHEPALGVPAADDETVYALTLEHELIAARIADGRIRWRIPLDATSPTFGSRVILRGDIVVAGDYDLMGIDRRSGQMRWIYAPTDNGGAGLLLGDASDTLALTGSLSGYVRAVDVRTGRPRWQHQLGPPDGDVTVYHPVLRGRFVAASYTVWEPSAQGGVAVVDFRSGRLLWDRIVPGSIGNAGRPVIALGRVFVASRDGSIHSFDVETGEPVHVIPPVPAQAGEQDYRPLVVSGGVLIAGSLSGEVYAYDLRSRLVRWRRPSDLYSVLFEMIETSGVVYLPIGTREILALRARDGHEVGRFGGSADSILWAPMVRGRHLFASGTFTLTHFEIASVARKGARQ